MIENLAKKIVTQYDNLSPKRKALADIASAFVGVFIGTGLVAIMAHFGLWMEFAIFMVCYGIWGMLKLIYQSRVDYYETQAHLKEWKR